MKAQFLLVAISTIALAAAVFTPYPNVYNEADAIEFAHIASMNYCPISEILDWSDIYNVDALPGYEIFFATQVNVTGDETFLFSMVVNHDTQRFVTSFRGTVGNTELAIEVLMSIVPVKFTI